VDQAFRYSIALDDIAQDVYNNTVAYSDLAANELTITIGREYYGIPRFEMIINNDENVIQSNATEFDKMSSIAQAAVKDNLRIGRNRRNLPLRERDAKGFFTVRVGSSCGRLRILKERRRGVYFYEVASQSGLGTSHNESDSLIFTAPFSTVEWILMNNFIEVNVPLRDDCARALQKDITLTLSVQDMRFTSVVMTAEPFKIKLVPAQSEENFAALATI
jgi:hypothetical protein